MANLNLTLNQIADWLGLQPPESDLAIHSVSTDTRTVTAGALFIALKGDNFDGHDYVGDALNNGAVAAIVEKLLPLSIPQFVVDDCRVAYGQIAAKWHKLCNVITAVITGSNGKTTVKQMVTAILSLSGKTTATIGNYNNDIGVPKTLLSISPQDEYAVIEMGANHPGEIGYLTHLVESDVALVNNAMSAHIEGFGSLKGVAKAKGEIYSGLKPEGVAIINNDDIFSEYWKEISGSHKQLTFGLSKHADITTSYRSNDSGATMHVSVEDCNFTIQLKVAGKHNITNALAAIAVAHALNIEQKHIKRGIETFKPAKGRLNQHKGIAGSCVIDDSYNANPDSVSAAIDVLTAINTQTILVLGDMAELGDNSLLLHKQIARYAKDSAIDYLFAVGVYAQMMASEFGENGIAFSDHHALIDHLTLVVSAKSTVLVKGSRSSHMELIVNAIKCEDHK